MSQVIHVKIDRLVLKGIDPSDRLALVRGLRTTLPKVLAEASTREALVCSRRTAVIRVLGLPLEPGLAGARKLGGSIARVIGRGLKP